jgi:hypothetical protein
MPLPHERRWLEVVTYDELGTAIRERRQVLRDHRDQKGDDRCWLDDYKVWAMIQGAPVLSTHPPPYEIFMSSCLLFYEFCRMDEPDPIPIDALLEPALWDHDLRSFSYDQMIDEMVKIQQAIFKHLHISSRPRTVRDCRELYSVLPEKIPADFRLPPREEFLGRARRGAGCPQFWESHRSCTPLCNLHQWGPCVSKSSS